MKMQIPYSKFELQVAGLGLEDKLTDTLKEELAKLQDPEENKMKLVAKYSGGISVETLVNSPNFRDLIARYDAFKIQQFIETCMKCDLTCKEAWAIFVAATSPELLDLE
jgi:hypothetical protein